MWGWGARCSTPNTLMVVPVSSHVSVKEGPGS